MLSQGEEKYFIDQVPNNVTLFKGSIFTNDQFRDEELRIEFAINSKFDGFNISKQVEFDIPQDLMEGMGKGKGTGIYQTSS